jgi:hypothetical protein
MQENLNHLNKCINQLRKNIINLVSTSSMISGLKQEAHLSELIEISIGYVRELRRFNNKSIPFTPSNFLSSLESTDSINNKQQLKNRNDSSSTSTSPVRLSLSSMPVPKSHRRSTWFSTTTTTTTGLNNKTNQNDDSATTTNDSNKRNNNKK